VGRLTRTPLVRRLATATAAGLATGAAARQIDLEAPASGPWERVNYRGRAVDVRGGLALATGLLVSAARSAPRGQPRAAWGAVAAVGAATAAGWADDLAGDASARGLGGHLAELRRGRITTGMVKLVAIPAGAAVFAATRQSAGGGRVRRLALASVDVALVAGAANLANLLDLRPGRALTAAAAPAACLAARGGPGSELAAGTLAAAAAAAPDDRGERTMLGDSGANALGAAVGVAAARNLAPAARAWAAAAVAALILISERVSFTRGIARQPLLRGIDNWGRVEEGG
jgi:UDP-N-acetylmuramyl pentapeptide phosphotransferase/UDP-N-acetylglucosamine-1-phosphate transferase